jgi:hypothetical protein
MEITSIIVLGLSLGWFIEKTEQDNPGRARVINILSAVLGGGILMALVALLALVHIMTPASPSHTLAIHVLAGILLSLLSYGFYAGGFVTDALKKLGLAKSEDDDDEDD